MAGEGAKWALQPAVRDPPQPRTSHTARFGDWHQTTCSLPHAFWSPPCRVLRNKTAACIFSGLVSSLLLQQLRWAAHTAGEQWGRPGYHSRESQSGRMNHTSQTPALTRSVIRLSYSFLTFKLYLWSTIFLYFHRTNIHIFSICLYSVYLTTYMPSSSGPSPLLPLMNTI